MVKYQTRETYYSSVLPKYTVIFVVIYNVINSMVMEEKFMLISNAATPVTQTFMLLQRLLTENIS